MKALKQILNLPFLHHEETNTVEFKLVPIPSLLDVGNERIAAAVHHFAVLHREEQWLDAVGKNFTILGPLLQNELLKSIRGVDNKTKMIFVDVATGCNDENFCRFTRPARLVSHMIGMPDELYNEQYFIDNILEDNGERFRDWSILSIADLFRNRSDQIGSLHYSTPWGVECEAIFDVDPKNGPEVKAERRRKKYLMLTPRLSRKVLYKFNTDLRTTYEMVGKQLENCVPIFQRYGQEAALTELSNFDFGIYQ